ncbi:inter-alpha-trypsin inhibitor heavy chain H3-like [Sphaeramia orbicularis]|uniref:inter-alpha-trypsin inhibitor heavy chain H3-like n=1 Tax=Sphaeramia orbicularis TaxID=375764 RepID=UPI00117CF069|nr:inter-alpha-trypsin inhibitor heavy chain H3-like [Sphaeramia orbicularis]
MCCPCLSEVKRQFQLPGLILEGVVMERAAVSIALLGVLLAVVTTLPNKDDWDIYSFHINSTVSSRYATTVITSRVANRMDESKEIEFHVRIPKNAFISKFRMFMDGEVYDGVVKAKEQAQQQYTEAVSRGQSAGIVSSVGRTLEEFKTSVNVAAHKKVTFELTYEELLKRKLGKYELQIHARPMQPVKDFKVDVYIHEEAGINFLEVKGGLSTKALGNAITKTLADKQAWVYFYPTEDQQKTCDSCGEQGMNGDLVIVYDVNRDTTLGDITASAGYFVHHFAPSSLTRIPKNVVFVIDQSGSMSGRKIHQTRIALIHILNDLAEEDFFGLITFDGNIFHWKRELVQANQQNVGSAKEFARNIRDRGSTDINRAVLEGARMLNAHPREGSASILILLTDGDPTSGETNLERIQSNVKKAIASKFPLYCLGFGFDVNFEFLESMSLQNDGVARRIYEDSDADLQLKGFYEEVATPLLTDVTMIYIGGTNLTQTNFSQYYNGSEIVVAGQITDNNIETFTPQVLAISRNTRMTFTNTDVTVELTGTISDNRIQRVWAYLTVKQLLEKELQLSGPEKETVKKEAMELSLKYSFVTPLTSMVVTKPPGERTDVLHKPKEGERLDHHSQGPAISPVHRFLTKAEHLSLPLCFDVSNTRLKLLHHPNWQLSVNGELDSAPNGGFQRIVIHFQTNLTIEVDTSGFTVREGQISTRYTGQDNIAAGRATVIKRDKETDITVGETRLVILLHETAGKQFLWPVLRQVPSDNNTEGILVLKPEAREEVQQSVTKVKINDQEINVTRSHAADYSVASPPSLNCWLTSAESVLQRPLDHFTVTAL